MKHSCPYCELLNRYTGKCTYSRCPLDDESADEDAKAKAYDAYYMCCTEEEDISEEEAAAERYRRQQE